MEVKYGIVGVGLMGREHMMNIAHLRNEGASVKCVADPHVPSQQQALAIAESFNWNIEVFSSHKELLESGLCDAVIVSTPNMTHYQILMDIINHPTPHHILVEKPLCTTVKDCKKVIDAARRRPEILVQVGLEYRYMPPVAKLIEVVKTGTLGQIKMVAIREHRFPFLVKVNDWNRFNANSGGTLVEKCCHFFDLMRLFAAANPVRVMASGAIDVNHKDEIYDGKVPDIIDNAFVIIEFDNGCRSMLDLCMFAEGSKNEQEISVVGDIGKWGLFFNDGAFGCAYIVISYYCLDDSFPPNGFLMSLSTEVHIKSWPDLFYVVHHTCDLGFHFQTDLKFLKSHLLTLNLGEAFVPESIVRVGMRAAGRAGVQTVKAEDKHIKYEGLHHGSSFLEHLHFLSAIKAQGDQAPAASLHDGLLSVAMGVAGQLSIERGSFVTIEEVMSQH